jgi:hypothetical protein
VPIWTSHGQTLDGGASIVTAIVALRSPPGNQVGARVLAADLLIRGAPTKDAGTQDERVGAEEAENWGEPASAAHRAKRMRRGD